MSLSHESYHRYLRAWQYYLSASNFPRLDRRAFYTELGEWLPRGVRVREWPGVWPNMQFCFVPVGEDSAWARGDEAVCTAATERFTQAVYAAAEKAGQPVDQWAERMSKLSENMRRGICAEGVSDAPAVEPPAPPAEPGVVS